MRIERREEAGWLQVVAAGGELDAYTGPELQEALTAALQECHGPPWLLVDLSEVLYLDCMGLGILVQAAKGAMAVACDTPVVLKVFDISGTRDMLGVRPDAAAAEALLAERREGATP